VLWEDGAVVVGVVLGVALLLISLGLAIRSQDVINRVTSRSLGTLAPGYAATRWGYMVYVGLVQSIGLAVLGLGWSAFRPSSIELFWIGSGEFVGLSVAAIAGEVKTYRALKR
jgi:hypothetical protein